HPARRGTVHVELVADARVQRGDDVRLTLDLEADVTEDALVEDRLDRLAVVERALRLAPDPDPVRRPQGSPALSRPRGSDARRRRCDPRRACRRPSPRAAGSSALP